MLALSAVADCALTFACLSADDPAGGVLGERQEAAAAEPEEEGGRHWRKLDGESIPWNPTSLCVCSAASLCACMLPFINAMLLCVDI